MSYARVTGKQKIVAVEVSDLLAEAERIDKDEDAETKAALEEQARQRAAAEAVERARSGEGRGHHRAASRCRSRSGGPETAGATQLHRSGLSDHEDRGRVVRSASMPRPSATLVIR